MKFRKLLKSLIVIFSGMILSSLWITKTENWKMYLPIVLLSISHIIYTSDDI